MATRISHAVEKLYIRLRRRIRRIQKTHSQIAAESLASAVDTVAPLNEPSLELLWSEDFDGDLSNWNQDDHVNDSLHRTGYEHLELDGTENQELDYIKVAGRWASLMHKHRDKVQFIRDGMFVLKGYAEKIPNPYRKNFADKPYGDWQIFGGWVSTGGRIWSEEHQRQIIDWSRTKLAPLGPGHTLKVRASVENLIMAGGRFSVWGKPLSETKPVQGSDIPAIVSASDSYDDDPAEMEINAPEIENPQRYDEEFGQNVFMKCVGGEAGDTPNGMINVLKKHGIDIRKGFHVYELVHHHDGTLDFKVDGVVVNHEPRKLTMWWYVILSNEFCSGCKDPVLEPEIAAHEHHADGPYQPVDPGLSGRSCIDDIDLIDRHEAVIDYVHAYKHRTK